MEPGSDLRENLDGGLPLAGFESKLVEVGLSTIAAEGATEVEGPLSIVVGAFDLDRQTYVVASSAGGGPSSVAVRSFTCFHPPPGHV